MSDMGKALADFKAGEFLIVTDDESRENEGDLILLAEKATEEQIAFMVRYTSGVICGVVTTEIAKRLNLPLMVKRNEDNHTTAFTVTVDAIAGRTTGISAKERANTLRALADPASKPDSFSRPGHVFPLISVDGGLHERQGHTEASIALCELTNSTPVGVLSELVNDDGTMMRGVQLEDFAKAHNLQMISIEALLKVLPQRKVEADPNFLWADLPISDKVWKVATHVSPTGSEHAILKLGDITKAQVMVRLHSECLTGDVFGSLRCDCGPQLERAISEISAAGSGLIIYLRDHEGRGIGLSEKIKAYELQDKGSDTVQANLDLGHPVDDRSYVDAADILHRLNINSIELLSNNPEKSKSLISAGIAVTNTLIQIPANSYNRKYLEVKRDQLKHTLGEI